MSERIIEEFPLTKSWLADVIEKKLGIRPKIGTSSTLENAEFGYMSAIRKVSLIFDDEQEELNPNLPKNVVLKIPNTSKGNDVLENAGETRETADSSLMERFMHDTECDYYNVLSKPAEKPLKVPTIYSCISTQQKDFGEVAVIVMEMFDNCHVYDLCQGFDEPQLYKIIDEIVKLHIFSLTTEEWKSIKLDEGLAEIFMGFDGLVRSVADKLSDQPGMEKLKIFIRNTFDKQPHFLFEEGRAYVEGTRPSVLCHGDLWAPQILWTKEDELAGIIDWQLTHRGSPMEDIHHVLVTCATVENRKKLTKPLLDYYFNSLSDGLKAKGQEIPWTREKIDEEFKHSMPAACAKAVFANGFWSNSPVLQTNGKPDLERIAESFGRCRSFVQDTIDACNMS